ncbi:MAG: hypothetical protein ACI9DO_002122 [Reinekea sp.]|jgi:hypothetical protein
MIVLTIIIDLVHFFDAMDYRWHQNKPRFKQRCAVLEVKKIVIVVRIMLVIL